MFRVSGDVGVWGPLLFVARSVPGEQRSAASFNDQHGPRCALLWSACSSIMLSFWCRGLNSKSLVRAWWHFRRPQLAERLSDLLKLWKSVIIHGQVPPLLSCVVRVVPAEYVCFQEARRSNLLGSFLFDSGVNHSVRNNERYIVCFCCVRNESTGNPLG